MERTDEQWIAFGKWAAAALPLLIANTSLGIENAERSRALSREVLAKVHDDFDAERRRHQEALANCERALVGLMGVAGA